MGSLPHVASKLVAGEPVVIVAFGSSSTQGYGSTSPDFNYPNRLAAQLRRHYPTADITVINRGQGGEDAPEMMKRLKTAVLDLQAGSGDLAGRHQRHAAQSRSGRDRQAGRGRHRARSRPPAPIWCWSIRNIRRAVNERAESAGKMIKLLDKVAELRHVGIFPRFEVMRDWHEKQAMPFENFVIADGLHMNDWGYACFAQLLGDDIISRSARSSSASTCRPTCGPIGRCESTDVVSTLSDAWPSSDRARPSTTRRHAELATMVAHAYGDARPSPTYDERSRLLQRRLQILDQIVRDARARPRSE